MVAYCAAVGFTPGVASGAAPFASARIATYASTTACTSAVLSVASVGNPATALLIALRFPAVTPVTPAAAYVAVAGAVLVPSYDPITTSAAAASPAAVVTRACNSLTVSTPLPSSAVAAIAATTAARLSAVTPVTPSAVS